MSRPWWRRPQPLSLISSPYRGPGPQLALPDLAEGIDLRGLDPESHCLYCECEWERATTCTGSLTQTIGKAFSLAEVATDDETYHS